MKHGTMNSLLLSMMVWLTPAFTISQTNFWEPVSGTESIHEIIALAFHPNGTIFAGSDNMGMYRSTDNGTTWSAINNGLTTPYIRCIAVDMHGHIFLGTDSHIFKSTDNGDNWSDVNLHTGYWVNSIIARNETTLVAEFGHGMHQSTDDGASWSSLGLDIFALQGSMAMTPNGNLVAGDARKGIYLSKNGGATWSLRKKLRQKNPQFGYLVKVGADGNLYAMSTSPEPRLVSRFFISKDNGETWRARGTRRNPNSTVTPIFSSLLATADGRLFAGDFSRGVIMSHRNPNKWTQLNSGLPAEVGTFSLTLGPDVHLYAGTGGGLYRSASPMSIAQPISREEGSVEKPASYALRQNYPNPFNPTTTIEFDLPEDALVTMKVFNTLGQEVATLVEREEFGEGTNEMEFDASSLPSGVYYYRIVAEKAGGTGMLYANVRKMLLVK